MAQINKLLKLKEACDVKSISVVDVPGFGFSKVCNEFSAGLWLSSVYHRLILIGNRVMDSKAWW